MDMKKLDRVIKKIWKNELQNDFKNNLILNEDTLKNALYHHLRTYFEKDKTFKDLFIFTECYHYGFYEIGYRPDLIIAIKDHKNKSTYKDIRINDVIAIFELKYKSEKCSNIEDEIYHDFDKFKLYKNIYPNCQFYNMAISLGDFNRPAWLDKKSTNHWANGCVTELIAYEPKNELDFQIYSYNGMNEDLNTK